MNYIQFKANLLILGFEVDKDTLTSIVNEYRYKNNSKLVDVSTFCPKHAQGIVHVRSNNKPYARFTRYKYEAALKCIEMGLQT